MHDPRPEPDHKHPKPTNPHKPKKLISPMIPVTRGQLNEWADHLYHYLEELREALDDHIHDKIPPAHTAGGHGEKGVPTEVLEHIAFPPEPPWEME